MEQSIYQQINLSTNQLIPFTLHLADTTLILSHKNSEWCGHGPILEQDIALTNIALDLLGQARNFYQYAATLIGDDCDEDKLAYLRNPNEYKNHLLVEQPNVDWAVTILRQFYFSCFQHYFYSALQHSNDNQLAAIATKALKEVAYHLRFSSEWVIRFGDGTEVSNGKVQKAVEVLKDFVDELFVMSDYETALLQQNISVDLSKIKTLWQQKVNDVFAEATLRFMVSSNPQIGGKNGNHSGHLVSLLSEMQTIQRTYPNSVW
jgi:ring-1,2-phenylacetyl-CoA epoxidase subunit PaaC